jgi:hypothetical protein
MSIGDISNKVDRFDRAARQEKLHSPQIIQKTKAVRYPEDIKIFEVDSNATGDGIYNCHEKLVVDADWDLISGAAKIWDKDETPETVEVLNLDEHNPDAGQHNLVEGDILAAWEATDDEGTKRWVGILVGAGTGIHKAFCKTNAGAATTIVCFLDVDTTGDEITVNCTISGGGHLDDASPHLTDGLEIPVWNDSGTWKCLWGFQNWGTC